MRSSAETCPSPLVAVPSRSAFRGQASTHPAGHSSVLTSPNTTTSTTGLYLPLGRTDWAEIPLYTSWPYQSTKRPPDTHEQTFHIPTWQQKSSDSPTYTCIHQIINRRTPQGGDKLGLLGSVSGRKTRNMFSVQLTSGSFLALVLSPGLRSPEVITGLDSDHLLNGFYAAKLCSGCLDGV